MKLFYYRDPVGNFGDDLNPWLWPKLLPDLIDDNEQDLFVGIGTILDKRIPQTPRKFVFGAGCGYGEPPALPLDNKWRIYCVRGPLTARALGLPTSAAVLDPAVLVRPHVAAVTPRHGVSLMLHHKSHGFGQWKALCDDLGITFIDPRRPVDVTLRALAATCLLLTEAMHGAIVADALRVRWVPLKISHGILDWKWLDWTQSLGLPYEPAMMLRNFRDVTTGTAWQVRAKNAIRMKGNARGLCRLAKEHPGFLSADATFHHLEDRLHELLAQLAGDTCV